MNQTLRRLMERASRRIVLRRSLPKRFGRMPIYVTPDSALSFWKLDWARAYGCLLDWAERYVSAGNVVWDIGANAGVFAFCAAHRAGPTGLVVAVEPDDFLVPLLRRTANANRGRCAPTMVVPVAISDGLSVQEFAIAQRGRSANFLSAHRGGSQSGGVRATVHVMTITLDWLATQVSPPDVLKIDVEGAEIAVLQGATGLLRDKRPLVLCEVAGEHAVEVASLLHTLGYELHDLDAPDKGPVSRAAFNTLAVPGS